MLHLTHHTWSTQQGVRAAAAHLPPSPFLPLPPPCLTHHQQHLSIQAVRSLVGLQEEEGSAVFRGLTMIKTHSEEPLKSPVPIMESLIGAYSAGKVFSGGEKKFQGSNNHFVCCLVYVKFMQRSSPSPSPNSFCCLFSPFFKERHPWIDDMHSLESSFHPYLKIHWMVCARVSLVQRYRNTHTSQSPSPH